MSGSLNLVQLIGNVGRDPEIRTTQSGDKVASLSLAVSEAWKGKDGEKHERTEWARVVVWGALAGVVEAYVRKGSKLYVSGQMQTREWERNGEKRYTTEVVLNRDGKLIMLDGRSASGDTGESPRAGTGMAPGGHTPGGDLDDEVPFLPER